eukprot:COSAG04_NODE_19542_length_413_cov_43.700637_2_plen_75_part_01
MARPAQVYAQVSEFSLFKSGPGEPEPRRPPPPPHHPPPPPPPPVWRGFPRARATLEPAENLMPPGCAPRPFAYFP